MSDKTKLNLTPDQAEKLLPEVAMQLATRYRQESIEGSQIFQLTEEWQAKVLADKGYAEIVRTPAELEDVLQDELPANIIIPDDAAITQDTLRAVLSRNSLTKNIFLGKREFTEDAE